MARADLLDHFGFDVGMVIDGGPLRLARRRFGASYHVIMDNSPAVRETWDMVEPGSTRQRLERTLNAAYAEGVLSQNTLVHRLDQLFAGPLVDPARLIGDLSSRKHPRLLASVGDHVRAVGRKLLPPGVATYGSPVLLALDWNGGHEELVIGRNPTCDVVLPGPAVSRLHARLNFRDGSWILQDLDSTNGTVVNGAAVGLCKLQPGDRVIIGDEQLIVD